MITIYPVHDVIGPNWWFGQCPASWALVKPDGSLTDEMRANLEYQRRIQEKEAPHHAPPPRRTPEQTQDIARWSGDDAPMRERPARPKVAWHGHPWFGKAPRRETTDTTKDKRTDMTDDSHSTTKGLAELAVNQMGITQDLLARLTTALDEAEALAVAAESQVDSVAALVTAAVGDGSRANAAGTQMAEQTAMARSTIADQSDGILPALQLTKTRVESAFQQIAAAVDNGRQYIGTLS